ncbi:hypothetical protein V7O66_09915 [Methanolobus sp. ZRKC3]|uniref:DUF5817 domain-containing protein n=1 Tax=Methanolobus sp. ZRKC3 TaxID=3125786 RepID=UPI003252673A
MPRYGVIVCPKCREQAQIIEIDSAKSTQCQRCSAKLASRKLRLFYSSDELAEAVSVRTQIQAKLHDSRTDIEDVLNGSGFKNALNNREETELSMKDFVDRREQVKPKRNPSQLVLELLRINGGSIKVEELRESLAEHGVDGQRFESTLEKLLHSGSVYRPNNDLIAIV